MRNEVHYIKTGYAFLMQEIHRVRIFFSENRHQYVCPGDLLLSRRLHMQNGALDHALKSERGLRINVLPGHDRGMFSDEIRKEFAQLFDIGCASTQHIHRRGVIQHRQQQMLDSNEFVAFLPSIHERHVQTDFQLLRNHVSSITH